MALALWMVLEYFVVNWPHFVLPKFLCKIPFVGETVWFGRIREELKKKLKNSRFDSKSIIANVLVQW